MRCIRRSTCRRWGSLLTLFTVAILLTGCTAFDGAQRSEALPADSGRPSLVIDPLVGNAGQYVQIQGTGWPANELVLIHLQDERGRSGILATDVADARGEIVTGFTWPIGARWLEERGHTILARTQDDDRSATVIFVVGEGIAADPGTPVAISSPTTIPEETETPPPSPAAPTSARVTTDVRAARLGIPPRIDGDLEEWSTEQGYRTPHIVETDPAWDGSVDVDAIWYLGWDESALYFGIQVSDERHVQENTAQFSYYGDGIEIQLDTDRDGDLGPSVNQDDFQFVVSPGDFGGRPAGSWRFRGDDAGLLSDAPGSGVRVASRQREGGYTLEFAIPWSDLEMVPRSGLTLGATFDLNDNDTPGSTQTQFLMLSNVPGRLWRTPDTWGTLTLE